MASTPYNFRLNQESDKHLIDMLENSSSKSELIKNALFHYFIHIAKGEIIDRELPIGWGWDTFSNLTPPSISSTLSKNSDTDNHITCNSKNDDEDYEDDEDDYDYEDDEDDEEYGNVNVEIEI